MDSVVREDNQWLNVTCPICGKKFHRKPYSLKKTKTPCCSLECSAQARKEWMRGEKNHQYGLRGFLNSTWNGKFTKTSRYGYTMVYCPDHPFCPKDGYMFEHRLIAEQYLLTDENSVVIDGERYLKHELHIHHINGIKTDNRPENLVVMTKSEHQRLHSIRNNKTRKRDALGRFTSDKIRTV